MIRTVDELHRAAWIDGDAHALALIEALADDSETALELCRTELDALKQESEGDLADSKADTRAAITAIRALLPLAQAHADALHTQACATDGYAGRCLLNDWRVALEIIKAAKATTLSARPA